MIKKYRKKPIVIEAMEVLPTLESLAELSLFAHPVECSTGGYCKLYTPEGPVAFRIGDFVVKGAHGEFYPVKGDIFRETYEEAKL